MLLRFTMDGEGKQPGLEKQGLVTSFGRGIKINYNKFMEVYFETE